MARLRITLPLGKDVTNGLRVGDRLLLTGSLLVARDAAHKLMVETLSQGVSLPFSLAGETIYYMGPTPAPPGRVVGAAGPTTSQRMDPYLPVLLEYGLVATIGKGPRSREAKEVMRRFGAVYLVTTGGAGALLAKHIVSMEVLAYEDLGPEAVRRVQVVDFPVIVAYDTQGGDIFEEARRKWKRDSQGQTQQDC